MDDVLAAAAQPHCPTCDVVMRDVPGGWVCPECEYREHAPPVEYPVFDGPSIHGG